MARYKKSIISLAVLCIMFVASAIYMIVPKKVYATGQDITLSEDFTAIRMSESIAYSYDNLVSDANAVHGAVPGSVWGAQVSGGNAELIYKLESDDGYVFSTSRLTFTVGSGHGSGVYWYNGSFQGGENVLGNNLIVYVSPDNENWICVYNLDEAEHPTHNAQDYYSNKYSPDIDLTQFAKNADSIYVKFDIKHFTTEECGVPTWTGIPLNQVGLGMYSVNITATQGEVSDAVVSSDFTSAGLSASSNSLYDYNNVVTDINGHLTYGLIPAESWAGYVKILSDAYVTYRLKAVNGYAFSSLNVDLGVAFGHNGIVKQAEKTDVVVAISYDNVSYNDVYSLRADETAVAVGETEPKGAGIHEADKRYVLNLDLGDKIDGAGELFVRIKLVVPDSSELTETGLTTDGHGNKLIPLGVVGARLYTARITAGQSKIAGITVANDWGSAGSVDSFDGIVGYDSVVKDTTNGNTTFGLIPASNWGDPVNSISTGYVTYKISATDTYVLNSLLLKMKVRYGASSEAFKNGASDFIIYTSYDGINFSKFYSLYEARGIDDGVKNTDFAVDLSSVSKNYGVLYVKIAMVCPFTELVNLQKIPTCLLSVNFDATQASVVANAFSVSEIYGNSTGTALNSNYSAVTDSQNVYDGNKTFGLIPSAGWGGTVDASDGYVTYKFIAPSDKSFNNIRMQLAFKLKSGANVIVYTSYDGNSFTEFYNVAERLGNGAYNNKLTWTLGEEDNAYQILDIDFRAVAENAGTFYVKIAIDHPDETVVLQDLKAEIFSVRFSGNYSDYSPYVGKIICNLDGGNYEGAGNPETYTAEDGIITLINPVRQYKEFMGWYDNPEFSGNPITTIDSSVIATYRLYAKWQDAIYSLDIRIEGTGLGTLKVDGVETDSSLVSVNAGSSISFELIADADSLIYSLNINGEDKFLTDRAFTLRNIDKDTVVIATFNERATLYGDFYIDYTDNVKYGNKWKKGLYDFANLYITDDERHALGINGGQGYLVYKFEAPDGKYFESAELITYAKLFDNYLLGDVEKVDYYIGYDNVDYTLVYKSELNRNGENYVKVVQNLTEYVIGEQSFFLKVEIGSNSTNWTLVNWLDISFTYETVELTVDFGGYYTEVTYAQLKGLPLDLSLLSPREGYVLSENTVYTDAGYNNVLDADTPIMNDMTLYVRCSEADGSIAYVLDGGTNHQDNPSVYDSDTAIALKDPVKEGYIFAGWYTDADFVNLIVEIAQGRTGNITVYAKWISAQIPDVDFSGTITYVLSGGTNSSENPAEYVYGDEIVFGSPTRDGYTFDGWYTDEACTNRITGIGASDRGDFTVYAKWVADGDNGRSGCSGGFDAGIIGIVAVLAGVTLVASKKFRKVMR